MTATAPVMERRVFRLTASWTIVWESPFWAILLMSSLLPASLVPSGEWFGVPMRVTDVATLLGALFYGLAGMLSLGVRTNRQSRSPLVPATLLLLAYGFIRLVTGPLESEDQLGMAFSLLLTLAAPMQAAGVLSFYDREQVQSFLNRLVIFLAMICLIYTAESVLGLGLRSEAGNSINSDFGIQRVRGPLFGSSTGYMLILPAFGWTLHTILQNRLPRSLAVATAFCLLAAYLGLGSRAGLILFGLFLAGLIVILRQLKKSGVTVLLTAVLSIGSAVLVYSRADTQRFSSFEDTHRRLTYQTAWNIIASEGPGSLLAGQGYGSIWSWYRRDILNTSRIALGDNLVMTGYGNSLYHAHSTLLVLVIEFGLAGIVWLAFTVRHFGRMLLIRGATAGWRVFTFALLVSLLSYGFDLFLFKEVRVNAVWWLFAIAAYQLQTPAKANER